MTFTAMIRRALNSWANWQARKAMHRAVPKLRELDALQATYRREHRRGSARIIKAKRDAVCASMARRAVR
jgi:hypothetical protein